jgi:hypothetical protein
MPSPPTEYEDASEGSVETELHAMRSITQAFALLNRRQHTRVLRWVNDRFQDYDPTAAARHASELGSHLETKRIHTDDTRT